jgi:hypothetical protein
VKRCEAKCESVAAALSAKVSLGYVSAFLGGRIEKRTLMSMTSAEKSAT